MADIEPGESPPVLPRWPRVPADDRAARRALPSCGSQYPNPSAGATVTVFWVADVAGPGRRAGERGQRHARRRDRAPRSNGPVRGNRRELAGPRSGRTTEPSPGLVLRLLLRGGASGHSGAGSAALEPRWVRARSCAPPSGIPLSRAIRGCELAVARAGQPPHASLPREGRSGEAAPRQGIQPNRLEGRVAAESLVEHGRAHDLAKHSARCLPSGIAALPPFTESCPSLWACSPGEYGAPHARGDNRATSASCGW